MLIINGATATYGGINLLLWADGSSLGIPPGLLSDTPFTDYFIPGLLLLLFNGISSIIVVIIFICKSSYSIWLVQIQGLALLTYIVIQVLMIDVIVPLHVVCGFAGIVLILFGWLYTPGVPSKTHN